MKKTHSIISDHVYRGKHSGHINSVTRLIYAGKFFGNSVAVEKLIILCAGDIPGNKFDAIVPVKPTYNKTNFVLRIAQGIAKKKKIKLIDALYDKNAKCKTSVKGLRILVFDDVMYSGKTMKKAVSSVVAQKPKSISYFAIAKSKTFPND